jgi:hypothetical protein
MARAGFCTDCGGNVYLNEATGGCVNGHGPECISGVYEVGPARPPTAAPVPTPAPPAPAPQYAPPAAPVPQYAATQYPPQAESPSAQPPKKKRTGLIVAIVVIVLLLLCGCAIGGVLLFSSGTNSGVTSVEPLRPDPTKAKVTAAWTFYKAMGSGDIGTLMTVMPSDTVAFATSDFWTAFVGDNKSVFQKESWSGDTVTVAYTSTDGRKGTIILKPGTGDAVLFTQQFTGEATKSEGQIGLIEESGGWKVLSIKTGSKEIKLDAASLKALETTP